MCSLLGSAGSEYLRAFTQGQLNLLILVRETGIAKTRTVRAVPSGSACWIEGNATRFGMYEKLYRHRDHFVVIDVVDSLYADKSGIQQDGGCRAMFFRSSPSCSEDHNGGYPNGYRPIAQ
ncbi:MAG TPA: hypothetical protein VKU02_27655 [Gemmataceae bacterium]|nr:hypothetical protein [Gemmataceae bacterium]